MKTTETRPVRLTSPLCRLLPLLALVSLPGGPLAAQEATIYTAEEVREELADLARPDGYWLAENGSWTEGSGLPSHYAMRYEPQGATGLSATGCLWGIAGEETPVYWRFFMAWDATREAMLVYQVNGSGAMAVGHARPLPGGGSELIQEARGMGPDTPSRIRHLQERPDVDTRADRSFDWDGERWVPRAQFTWRWTAAEGAPC